MEIGPYLSTDNAILNASRLTLSLFYTPHSLPLSGSSGSSTISISLQATPTADWEIKCSLLNSHE